MGSSSTWVLAVIAVVGFLSTDAADGIPKKGFSSSTNPELGGTCQDACRLGLTHTWYFNWGGFPRNCSRNFAEEFVPMIWGCHLEKGCLSGLDPDFREQWKAAGVTTLMGFNEPDKSEQSNMSPERAANHWVEVDTLAHSFDPPLKLVGPAMASWGADGSSEWLDQFFGNLTTWLADRIDFLSQHDYSGDANAIANRARAAREKFGKKVWMTEWAVGDVNGGRDMQDDLLTKSLDLFEEEDAIYRYAWFSTRTPEGTFVVDANLLRADSSGGDSSNGTASYVWQPPELTSTGKIYAVDAHVDHCSLDPVGTVSPGTVSTLTYRADPQDNTPQDSRARNGAMAGLPFTACVATLALLALLT